MRTKPDRRTRARQELAELAAEAAAREAGTKSATSTTEAATQEHARRVERELAESPVPSRSIPGIRKESTVRTEGLPRDFRRLGEGRYLFSVVDLGIEFEVDRLRRERHSLVGELTVRCDIAGARTVDGVLSVGDFNLSSIRALEDRSRYLARRAKTKAKEIDWTGLLEEFVQRVVPAERAGDPAVSLRDLPNVPDHNTTVMVAGFPILTSHPQMIFGPGGSLKSLLALYLGGELVARGYRVLVVDWELSAQDHRDRLGRLFSSDLPDIRYVRAERPITYEVDRLRKAVRDHDINFVIFDSAGFGCYGPPEAAEAALNYFRAVRQLGEVGTLHIAHQTKSDEGDRAPFGSIFWFNSARSIWYVKPSEVTEPGMVTVGLFHRKANLGPLHPSLGFRATFTDDRIAIDPVNVATVGDLAAKLPLRERMKTLLKGAAMTPKRPECLWSTWSVHNPRCFANSSRARSLSETRMSCDVTVAYPTPSSSVRTFSAVRSSCACCT